MKAEQVRKIKYIALTVLGDVLTLGISVLLAVWICHGSVALSGGAWLWIGINAAVAAVVFLALGLYRVPLPFAGMSEAFRAILAFGVLAVFNLLFLLFEIGRAHV